MNMHVHMNLHYVLCFYDLFLACLLGQYRILAGEKCPHSLSLEPQQSVEKIPQETVICHSKPASLSSTESSEGSKSLVLKFFLFVRILKTIYC